MLTWTSPLAGEPPRRCSLDADRHGGPSTCRLRSPCSPPTPGSGRRRRHGERHTSTAGLVWLGVRPAGKRSRRLWPYRTRGRGEGGQAEGLEHACCTATGTSSPCTLLLFTLGTRTTDDDPCTTTNNRRPHPPALASSPSPVVARPPALARPDDQPTAPLHPLPLLPADCARRPPALGHCTATTASDCQPPAASTTFVSRLRYLGDPNLSHRSRSSARATGFPPSASSSPLQLRFTTSQSPAAPRPQPLVPTDARLVRLVVQLWQPVAVAAVAAAAAARAGRPADGRIAGRARARDRQRQGGAAHLADVAAPAQDRVRRPLGRAALGRASPPSSSSRPLPARRDSRADKRASGRLPASHRMRSRGFTGRLTPQHSRPRASSSATTRRSRRCARSTSCVPPVAELVVVVALLGS